MFLYSFQDKERDLQLKYHQQLKLIQKAQGKEGEIEPLMVKPKMLGDKQEHSRYVFYNN